MGIKGFSLDHDGCMVNAGGSTPWPIECFPALRLAFQSLKMAGIVPFANTGRPAAYMHGFFQALDFITDTAHICENGGVFFFPDREKWQPSKHMLQTSLYRLRAAERCRVYFY